MNKIFDFHICYIFNPLEQKKSFHLKIYFLELTAAINQPCFKAWSRMVDSDVKGSKITSRFEIIITISIEN